MAEAVSSPLTFRDFIRHLLPTAAAICLFAPLSSQALGKLEVTSLVFAAILLGYVVTTPLTKFVVKLYRLTPVLKRFRLHRDWMNKNWDLGSLFYLLTQEEREYLYLTASYADFFRLVSFYLLIYTGVNLFLLVKSIRGEHFANLLHAALAARTPVAGDLQFSTLLLLVLSPLLGYYLFIDFLTEYDVLFFENGPHDVFARKLHERQGGIAVSIWGKIRHRMGPVEGAKVELLSAEGKLLEECVTTSEGRYQFPGKYENYVNGNYQLRVSSECSSEKKVIEISEKKVPSFDMEVPFQRESKIEWTSVLTGIGFVLVLFIFYCIFFESDKYLKVLYLLSGIPFILYLVLYKNRVLATGPALSALLLLSFITTLTAIALSFDGYATLNSNKALEWSDLVLPYFTSEWKDLIPAVLIVILIWLNGIKKAEPSHQGTTVDLRIPRVKSSSFARLPVANLPEDQEYALVLNGENLQGITLIAADNANGKLEILTPNPAVDDKGQKATAKIKVPKNTVEGKYEIKLKSSESLPNIFAEVIAQGAPVFNRLAYGSDGTEKAPTISSTEQKIVITVYGENLSGAWLTLPRGFGYSTIGSSLFKLNTEITIAPETQPGNYDFQIKNPNSSKAAPFIFTVNSVSE